MSSGLLHMALSLTAEAAVLKSAAPMGTALKGKRNLPCGAREASEQMGTLLAVHVVGGAISLRNVRQLFPLDASASQPGQVHRHKHAA